MTLLDDAKIITTANAGKAGTLYSIKPDSGLADLDITRATTATRVDSAGVIESVAVNEPQLDYSDGSCPSFLVEHQRTNLNLYSEELDNAAWGKSDVTVTANAITSSNFCRYKYYLYLEFLCKKGNNDRFRSKSFKLRWRSRLCSSSKLLLSNISFRVG